MHIGMLIPTIADDKGKWREFFLNRMIPSLYTLRGFRFTMLLAFQRYSRVEASEVIRAVQSHGVRVRHGFMREDHGKGMAGLREACAELMPDADAYICADDDMIFRTGSNERYWRCADYLTDNEACGAIMCMGALGGHAKGTKIHPSPEGAGWWWTNRGLFLRRIARTAWLFCPPDAHDMPGGYEECYAVYSRINRGYYPAKTYTVPVTHFSIAADNMQNFLATRHKKGERYPVEEDIHNPSNQPILNLIRRKWDDPTWTMQAKRLPFGLKRNLSERRQPA